MRSVKLVTTLSLAAVLFAVMMPTAVAYRIDGNPSDWGIDILNGDWSLNETWVPNEGIEFIVEDNRDPRWGGTTGVHIKGVGSNYTRYYEDKVWSSYFKNWVVEPYGGEKWDLEAKYLDEDDEYIYVLLVTSLAPGATGDLAPGDLALDLDANASTGEFGYEYGVKLGTNTGLSQGDIYYLPDWEVPTYIPENRPTVFKGYLTGGYKTGDATVAYVPISVIDNGEPNYVVEVKIPKDAVGMAGKNLTDPPLPKTIYTCDACGNDHIENPIPEFLTVAIPAGMVIGLVYIWKRRQIK